MASNTSHPLFCSRVQGLPGLSWVVLLGPSRGTAVGLWLELSGSLPQVTCTGQMSAEGRMGWNPDGQIPSSSCRFSDPLNAGHLAFAAETRAPGTPAPFPIRASSPKKQRSCAGAQVSAPLLRRGVDAEPGVASPPHLPAPPLPSPGLCSHGPLRDPLPV